MQTIVVKYHGPNVRGARFVARSASGLSTVMPYDHVTNHDKHAALAAGQLAKRLNWTGQWHGGSIKGGWVFVCKDEDPDLSFEVK